MKIYGIGVKSKQGFIELRFRANADTNIPGVEPGSWYTVAHREDWNWTLEEKKTYCVTCDEAWLDKRESRAKFNVIHVRGHVTLEEHKSSD